MGIIDDLGQVPLDYANKNKQYLTYVIIVLILIIIWVINK